MTYDPTEFGAVPRGACSTPTSRMPSSRVVAIHGCTGGPQDIVKKNELEMIQEPTVKVSINILAL